MNSNNDSFKDSPFGNENPLQAFGNIDIKKYLKLLWRRKYWIILITILLSILWYLFASRFSDNVEYISSALIRFNDPRGVSAVTDFAAMNAHSKLAILYTRSFLGRVVDTLNYNFRFNLSQINPAKLVNDVEILPGAKYGNYKIVRNGNNLAIYYTNQGEKIENKNIQNIAISSDSSIIMEANDLRITFNSKELIAHNKIEFNFVPRRFAIDILKLKMEHRLDPSQTILSISYKDINPEFSAIVTNMLADLLVEQLLEYKKLQTSSMLRSFEDQLQAASQELVEAEEELKTFRRLHPLVFLERDRSQIVSQYAELETGIDDKNKNINIIKNLLNKIKQKIGKEEKVFIYKDILAFLQNQNVSGITSLDQQYVQLVNQRQRLISDNYPPEHPQVANIDQQMKEIENQIDQKAVNFYTQLNSEINNSKTKINSLYEDLKNLPRNELRLAELERNRQIKENIFATIMIHIEEAKVSDAAIIADAYKIDQAVPPIVYGGIMVRIKKYGPGPILGFIIAMSLFVLLDLLDPSSRSSKEVEKRLKLPLLATIPIIKNLKDVPSENPAAKKLDEKLITSDYVPNIAGESFRFLRTKLNMLSIDTDKTFIITSLNPGEGKSLITSNIAITFAQQKMPTLLVDCDLRRGVLHHSFVCKKNPGLSDLLIDDSVKTYKKASTFIQKTHIPNLSLLSSGKSIPNPSELLGSSRMEFVYGFLKKKFPIIIFDTPPFEFIPDAFALNTFVHRIILVVKYGKTNINRIGDLISGYKEFRNDFVGVIVNASQEVKESKYYAYSYYKY